MARLTRKNLKIFASGASNNGIFGSLQANNPVTTTDIEQIQSLPAWEAGWDSATETSEKLPPLEESQAIDYVETYQTAYILQEGVPEWLSTCEYHKGSWAKSDASGKWALYESLIDNNVGNVVSDTSKWQNISADSQKRNIGEIVTSTIPLSDAGLHLLDGTLISGSGSYAAFVSYISELYNSGDYTQIFDTEANWQSAVSTYGVCGKFVYDSVNNTVRLPKYSDKIYTSGIASTAPCRGNEMTLGLTDGTNNYGMNKSGDTNDNSYIFSINDYGTMIGTTTAGGYAVDWRKVGITTDASKSGIVADVSDIATPIDVYYYIVVATLTKTEIEVDIDQIESDLNLKADIDLSNVNSTGTSTGAGWAMPSDTFDTLTAGASGSSYTAPSNGYFYFGARVSAGQNSYIGGTVDTIYREEHFPWVNAYCSILYPVKKGDEFTISYSGTFSTMDLNFIYAVGSESEAS